MNTATAYINCGGEPVTMAEVARILTEMQDIATGIRLFCESRLAGDGLVPEEEASLSFINLGVASLLSGLNQTIPDTPVLHGGVA